jgi:hypothetical protein
VIAGIAGEDLMGDREPIAIDNESDRDDSPLNIQMAANKGAARTIGQAI